MTTREMELLEQAFSAEIRGAIEKIPACIQPRGKLAQKMVADGYLRETVEVWKGITIRGYMLTELGRITYCTAASAQEAREP